MIPETNIANGSLEDDPYLLGTPENIRGLTLLLVSGGNYLFLCPTTLFWLFKAFPLDFCCFFAPALLPTLGCLSLHPSSPHPGASTVSFGDRWVVCIFFQDTLVNICNIMKNIYIYDIPIGEQFTKVNVHNILSNIGSV